MAFDSAIYTDVRADEAVDGVDGFNFQSLTAGIDGADQRLIREHLLHQISLRWPTERDELEHPPTAAFLHHEGRFYFSRGHSTGATENGRRGNQLTQCVVTGDLDTISPYCPAQIFGAVNWRLQKAAGDGEPWETPLTLKPAFETDELLDWARHDPWVRQVLPSYLTMLEGLAGEQARKVVLIHDELDLVLRWMALGTLLLHKDAINGLELRAFVADPHQTSAQLVGVHPQLMPAPLTGVHSINLLERTVSPIDVSASAQTVCDWVNRLDTFDALEVIDIARRWMPAIGVRYGAAGAEMVTKVRIAQPGREEWDLGVEVIEQLATGGLRDDLELYLDELADSVSSYALRSDEDFARAARATKMAMSCAMPALAEALLAPSLESLAGSPAFAATWVREINPDGAWVWPTLENAQSLANNLSQVIQDAPDEALSGLLQLVQPLSSILSPTVLRPAVSRAAAHVAANPLLAPSVDGWYEAHWARRELRTNLIQQLIGDYPGARARVLREMLSGVWDRLDPSQETLTSEAPTFMSWLVASRLAREPVTGREASLRAATVRPSPDTWEFALHAATLPEHISLWVAWVQLVGDGHELGQEVLTRVDGLLALPAKSANAKDLQQWLPLLDALAARSPEDLDYQDHVAALTDYIGTIPSMKDRATAAAGSVKGFFTRSKKDQP